MAFIRWKQGAYVSASTALVLMTVAVLLVSVAQVHAGDYPDRPYPERPYVITEEREPCTDYRPERQLLFGDLHTHTFYSLDANTQDTRTTPDDAYRFAKGERIPVQPYDAEGRGLRSLQLARPLDFNMVTDHAELFGEVNICETPGTEGHKSWQCLIYRHWEKGAFYLFNTSASLLKTRLGFCGEDGELCREAAVEPWKVMQQAAESHYDRSSECSFTSFVGYEWTGSGDNGANLHRNILFRNAKVPRVPFSFVDGPSAEQLYEALDRDCTNATGERAGCEVMAIPHNSNLSDGLMFRTAHLDGKPIGPEHAAQRQRLERVAEMMQHKGASECYFGAGTEDELCAFEQLPYKNFAGSQMAFMQEPAHPQSGFLREVLRDGLLEQQRLGVNPFKLGFVGATDTHIAASGGVDEGSPSRPYLGHGGAAGGADKPGLPDKPEYNPGGITAVWAEENTRDSIFAALHRRETYATSGPRIALRFFGGENFAENLCEAPDFAGQADASGVPMGADLPALPQGRAPSFAVSAMMDAGTPAQPGLPLQRLQIIKGWIDEKGERREAVYDVAGDANNGATVDLQSCQTSGTGFSRLCTVWTDPDFKQGEDAYYYSRVVQNPSCRWSQQICVANGVRCDKPETIGEGFEACCAAEHRPAIQERAWSSPIWYRAETE